MNHEIPDVQAGFRKDKGTRDQIANIHWIIGKAREFQKKNIYFCFILAREFQKKISTSALLSMLLNCGVDHNELWKILKEMGIQNYLTCLLRTLYAGQEASFRTDHGITD